MLILQTGAISELEVKNSRFISEVFTVKSQEEARERLRAQKVRYADASHVVHAFVVGREGGILGCSDDGEPSGTSGRPTLEVLKGSGITNIMLTTTRYFGGTKLGTGGLVKAYTESAQLVLSQVVAVEQVAMSLFSLSIPYNCYELSKRALEKVGAEITGERFDSGVSLDGRIRTSCVEELSVVFRDMSRGQAQWECISEEE